MTTVFPAVRLTWWKLETEVGYRNKCQGNCAACICVSWKCTWSPDHDIHFRCINQGAASGAVFPMTREQQSDVCQTGMPKPLEQLQCSRSVFFLYNFLVHLTLEQSIAETATTIARFLTVTLVEAG